MEKIALILIKWTWFWSSLLRSTLFVYFFCNAHATVINLAYFNKRPCFNAPNPQLAG